MRAATVYVNVEQRDVDLGRRAMGSVISSAVLDNGGPLILASGRTGNAVWGTYQYCECSLFSFGFRRFGCI